MAAWVRQQFRGAAALAAVTLVLGVVAVVHPGVAATRATLHDGGVWVTNSSLRLAGHLNYPSRTLDGGLRAPSADFDVAQSAAHLVFTDRGTGAVAPVDPALVALGTTAGLPGGIEVSAGADRVAFADAATGRVWVTSASEVGSFSPDAHPTLEGLPGARVVAATDGTVLIVTPDGAVRSLGARGVSDAGRLDGLSDLAAARLSAVGTTLVALDGRMLRTPRLAVELADADAVVQLPGADADRVLLATPAGLVWQPLSGGAATQVAADPVGGRPVRPVVLGGCGYGAWSGSGAFVRDCPGDADDVHLAVERIASSKSPVFRTNRDVIVLNDTATGLVLLVNAGMVAVENWQPVETQVKDERTKQDDTTTPDDALQQKADRSQQRPPEAVDDEFGVRPGRQTTLNVLANDTDPDGDVLTATVKDAPGAGSVARVRGGEALAYTAPEGATAPVTFTYTADDGRGGKASATVKVAVKPASVQTEPQQTRPSSLTVGRGGQASTWLLPDWRDPEGDDLVLTSVGDAAGLEVTYRRDGTVGVRDLGTAPVGTHELPVVVTDGAKEGHGTLRVVVKDGDSLEPVANADHVIAVTGRETVVAPLRNDVDPLGGTLRLADVARPGPGERILPRYANDTFTYTADAAGVRYVGYTVSNGGAQATGVVRIDVVDPSNDAAPVADRDLALVPQGGSVVADVLANDSDPGGGVLVVQSAQVPPEASGLTVEVIQHGLLRISARAGLSEPVQIGYTVSNGVAQTEGAVTVVPIPAGGVRPPVARDDTATVRAGDLVTLPVLDNDLSPTGLPITLDPTVRVEADAGGVAFASEDRLRYKAGERPGRVRIAYTVRDSLGNYQSAHALIDVVAASDVNTPAQPVPLTGRVLAGGTVRIPVQLDRIDAEGDSVTVLGVDTPAQKGTVQALPDALEYTAPADARGTDTFTYAVVDHAGVRSTGSVSVGIAPPPAVNLPPVAIPDDVSVRPSRQLSLPVRANDLDPDGDPLALVEGPLTPADDETTVPAEVSGDRVRLESPDRPGRLRYYYEVTDRRSEPVRGVVTIDVRPDAPLYPPTARDDVLTAATAASVARTDATGRPVVDVDVLANDSDWDGLLSDLRVTPPDGTELVEGRVRVPVAATRQIVLYTVTDADGQIGRAAIVVPGSDERLPYLRADRIPVRMRADETVTLALADYVVVREGRHPRLTFAADVRSGPGRGSTEVVRDATTLAFTADAGFSGDTFLTARVTDGAEDDPTALAATLTWPIIVEGSVNRPPVLRPTVVEAAVGEAARGVDLAPMASDPDAADAGHLTFAGGAVSGPFDARVEGSRVVVAATASAAPGASGSIRVTVTDPHGAATTADVPLRASASTRPLISATTAVVQADAGTPVTVDLARYLTNPFAAEGKPLTVSSAAVTAGAAGAPSVRGLAVTVTPTVGTHGEVTLTYAAMDATNDPSRRVQGLIRLTVRGVPDAPTGVRADTTASSSATVSWSAGANNGAPITGFTVAWKGGSRDCGAATTCAITGLTNGTSYTFTVRALNAVGPSADSAASNPVTPNQRPDQPSAPSAQSGDKQLVVTWPAGTTSGTPITDYEVRISPGGTVRNVGNVTTTTWPGLTNGTSYTFAVRAISAGGVSDWSPSSGPAVPVGVPLAPLAPSMAMDAPSVTPSGTLTWQAPNGNGDSNLSYTVERVGGGTVYTGTAVSTRVTMSVSTSDQTFRVRASNRAGDGAWSPASNPVRAFAAPGAVTGLSATATGVSSQVKVTFSPAPGNGATPSEIAYFWRANGRGGQLTSGTLLTDAKAFPNGSDVSLSVYAVSTVGGRTAQGPVSSTNVNAYGPPVSPTISCTGGAQSVTCSWDAGMPNGRPTTYSLTGDYSSASASAPGSYTFSGIGYSATKTLCIQAQQAGGLAGPKNCASATSAAAPPPRPPSITLAKGSSAQGQITWNGTPCGSACYYLKVTTVNFSSNVTCKITSDSSARSWTQGPSTTIQTSYFFGYPGQTVSAQCTNGSQTANGSITW